MILWCDTCNNFTDHYFADDTDMMCCEECFTERKKVNVIVECPKCNKKHEVFSNVWSMHGNSVTCPGCKRKEREKSDGRFGTKNNV